MGERPPCTQNIRLSISADRLQHSTMHRVSRFPASLWLMSVRHNVNSSKWLHAFYKHDHTLKTIWPRLGGKSLQYSSKRAYALALCFQHNCGEAHLR